MINNVNQNSKFLSPLLKQKLQGGTPIHGLKPNEAKGALISNKPLVVDAVIATKDTAKDVKNLIETLRTGKTNDHSLGRMNDLGLKAGGIAIASYLMTKKMTKTSKMMEFLGFGAFLSSMALWPRIFIDIPTRLMHGFNPSQKYMDSQGRKKEFFQDNQYLPWDIWDKEKINKVGDKMGVEKDIPEREEFIKKKMQKIALQDNTLWMLTAGFATPIITSLACDMTQPWIERKNTENIAKKSIQKLGNTDKDGIFGKIVKSQAGDIKNDGSGKKILKNLDVFLAGRHEKVAKFTDQMNLTIQDNCRREFIEKAVSIFDPINAFKNIDDDSMMVIRDLVHTKGLVESDIVRMLTPTAMDTDKYALMAHDIKEAAFKKPVLNNVTQELVKIREEDLIDILKKANGLKNQTFAENLHEALGSSECEYYFLNNKKYWKHFERAIDSGKYTQEFDTVAVEKLANQYDTVFRPLFGKISTVQEVLNAAVGRRTESLSTLTYKDFANRVMKEFGLTKEECKMAKSDYGNAYELVVKGLSSKVAKDAPPEVYDNFLKSIIKEQVRYTEDIDKMLKALGCEGLQKVDDLQMATIVKNGALKKIMDVAEGLDEGFVKTKKLFTSDGSRSSMISHFQNIAKKATINTDAIFARLVLAADFERKYANNEDFVKLLKSFAPSTLSEKELIEWCRKILIDDTMTDFANKNDIPFKELYVGLMDNLFNENGLSDATKNAFKGNEGLFERVQERIKDMRVTAFEIKSKEFSFFGGNERSLVGQGTQYVAMGKPLSELLQETATQSFNHNKWFKIFGTSFAVLAGVTILSQKFFGKIKDEHLYKKQENQELQGGAKNVNK